MTEGKKTQRRGPTFGPRKMEHERANKVARDQVMRKNKTIPSLAILKFMSDAEEDDGSNLRAD